VSRAFPDTADIAALRPAIEALRAGDAIVYPTETFYALGVDAMSPRALAHLFEIKGREPGKPVALIAADLEMALALASVISGDARRLADAFWPGPLTLVLPPRPGLPEDLIGPDGGIGVRVSSHPIARALSEALGRPITATSANLAGEPPAIDLAGARRTLGSKVKVFVEGGRLVGGAPSTVISVTPTGIRAIRAGAVTDDQIKAVLENRDPHPRDGY